MKGMFTFWLTQRLRGIAKPINAFLQWTWLLLFLAGTIMLILEQHFSTKGIFPGMVLGVFLGIVLGVFMLICTATANAGIVSAVGFGRCGWLPVIEIDMMNRYVKTKGKIQIAAAGVQTNLWVFGFCMILQRMIPSYQGLFLGMAFVNLFLAVYGCVFIRSKHLRYWLTLISLFPMSFRFQFWNFALQVNGQSAEIFVKIFILLQYLFLILGGQYLILEGVHKFTKKGKNYDQRENA